MADELGYIDPIGKIINNNAQDWKIIGVIDNFHFKSLQVDITPLTLALGKNNIGTISVKLNDANIKESLASIAAIWNRSVPDQEFSYTFLKSAVCPNACEY